MGAQSNNGGRGPGGRFAKGNPGGPGNPNAGQMARLRAALLNLPAIEEGIKSVFCVQLDKAITRGDTRAAKLVLSYLIGPPRDVALEERLDRIEAAIEQTPSWHNDGPEGRARMIREILVTIEADNATGDATPLRLEADEEGGADDAGSGP